MSESDNTADAPESQDPQKVPSQFLCLQPKEKTLASEGWMLLALALNTFSKIMSSS